MTEADDVAAAIRVLESGGPTQRRGAAVVLGQIRDARALGPLIQALGDEDDEVCEKALASLVKFRSAAIESLLEVLKHPRSHPRSSVRRRVVEILGRIGDDRAAGPLGRTLKNDGDYHVRAKAVEALQQFRNAAIGPLIESLKDKDWYVRWKAAQALGKIGNDIAVGPLELCRYDESKFVREAAAKALQRLRTKGKTT